MERREQVFVSSTYVDLVEERQEVIQTLLEANCIPAGMELFPASDDDRWTLIKRVIDGCDYYVIVVGGRYGSTDPVEKISYTEMEYDYAVSQKKPVMAFVHGDPDNIPRGKTDKNDDAEEQLQAFRDKVCQRMVKFWTSPPELGGMVAKSLIQIRMTHPAVGWVRGDHAMTSEVQQEMADLKTQVAQLQSRLATERAEHIAAVPEGLADGDEMVTLRGWTTYYPWKDWKAGNTGYNFKKTAWYDITCTWNEVFAGVAPSMVDECAESALQQVLGEFIRQAMNDEQDGWAEKDRVCWFLEAEPADETFDDVIKVQFLGLGLIKPGERKRAPSDGNSYWMLTPTGRELMLHLRGARKEDDAPNETHEPPKKAPAKKAAIKKATTKKAPAKKG